MEPTHSSLKLLIYSKWLISQASAYVVGHRPTQRNVWLTFDDGPHPIHTDRILDTLKAHNIRATFFMVGANVERHPDIVRRVVAEKHLIGNHSYSHPFLTALTRAEVEREIGQTENILRQYTQPGRPKLLRPPHGAFNPMVVEVAQAHGYDLKLWNAGTRDWHPWHQPHGWVWTGCLVVRLLEDSTVSMHDNLPTTAHYLDVFLDRLENIGVRFMDPDTLVDAPG